MKRQPTRLGKCQNFVKQHTGKIILKFSKPPMAMMPEMKDTSSPPPKIEVVTLIPLLPGQEKPKEEEHEEDDGSIIFEFEDEDGTVQSFQNTNESPDENGEKDGTTTTEEPIGLSPSCLASLCG